MALKARLSATPFPSGEKVVTTWEYFDDSAPSNVLAREQFSFDPGMADSDMSAVVVSRGQKLRSAFTKATDLATRFPTVTTVITIT